MLLAAVGLVAWLLGGPSFAETTAFAPGQHWSYATRPEDPQSTLIVGRVEEIPRLGTVVHVAIIDVNLHLPSGSVGHLLPHAPFSADALRRSVDKQLPAAPLPERFEDGYAMWRREKGGVYTITVREAVDVLQKTIDSPGPAQGQ
ncbi:MAG TPA: hypothetical protein VEN47_08420 [Myxococcota bacterium]|nr:hypothetical protein [Myxococcota bacterium]